jgi:predicted phage terminase large subunit-like protein
VSASSLLKWTKYIPVEPFAKQLAFLMLPHKEALYGGAVGGAKSITLLMGALQYVDIPGYSALILRKNLSDLRQPSALLKVAHDWLDGWAPEVKFIAQDHLFVFPSGATVGFGYIGELRTQDRYQGAEYHYIGFDELTQHIKGDYEWMLTRLRKRRCNIHPNYTPGCKFCEVSKLSSVVPLKLRGATNPGNVGHQWVKERFGIKKQEDGSFAGTNTDRPFIQAFVTDNPYLGQDDYIQTLQTLDPITRAQLLRGDWDVNEMGRFKPEWARYYKRKGDYYLLNKPHLLKDMFVFCTVDPAASLKTGIAGVTYKKDREPSWSVISTWGMTKNADLVWLDLDRFQSESPEVITRMKTMFRKWKPTYFAIEQNGPGLPIVQMAERSGLTTKRITTITDKIANAAQAQNRMSAGKVWIPDEAHWKEALLNELFNWTGQEHETNDQIDTLSNAAHETADRFAHLDREELGVGVYTADEAPFWV